MHIGLIGGIGPSATDFYYRALIKHAVSQERNLDLTMVHADTPQLLANLMADNQAVQSEIFRKLTDRLAASGADNVVVTAIAGHFCIDAFAEISPLPVIDLTKTVSTWLSQSGMKRVGIMGTSTVMASGMYGKLEPVEVMAPKGPNLSIVHDAYVSLAQSGKPTAELTDIFFSQGQTLIDDGADAVLLGGTDLNPLFAATDCGFPIVDCATIHIDEIARHI